METTSTIRVTADTDQMLDDPARWTAVLERDRRHDGSFVYAVRTTGIYCRPSCPSRRPRRESVEFFAEPAAAETAGYRACRRCHPRSAAGTPAEQALRRAVEHLDAHLDEPVTLARLAKEVGLSPFHLQRTFTERFGLSPRAYQDARRLERFRLRVQAGDSVSRATYDAGFNSSRSLYERAADGLGMTPGAYRRGGRGLEVRFTLVDSSLGRILVAATDLGVCAVALGGEDAALEAALRAEFPNAELRRDDDSLRSWADVVVRHAEGEHPGLAVPLDLQGTAFQMRVWQALRAIPAGETRTYAEVAAAIGQPSATRAVAGACARNKAALLVPCHRVVRTDGEPGGYRWGIERKRRLLEREGGRNAE
jgi:AraC family transcriptional regulator, regulatory protein of adaptative response / methylated-DNA-[protein]-cysteine methyltransferase